MPEANPRQPREDDPRFQRSLRALHAALLELVDAKPLEEISITALVQAAGVTRPTFYQHFADIPDAVRRAALTRLDAAFPLPEPFPEDFEASTQNIFQHVVGEALPVIEHLREHREFYLRVLDGAGNAAFFDEIVSFLAGRFLPDAFELAASRQAARKDDLMTVMAGGAMWLMVRWLHDDTPAETAGEMAQRIAAVAATMVAPLREERP
ncbi:TetR-like C-terminal domain-containing protein [Mesorhizobium sp. CAU 1732]|uniref:TetR/AcrR family transcriptional regulator n=1 Tax=Mesorhizobium sp. CAU 1732 TaxID=3140358 RepID=UPI0032617698